MACLMHEFFRLIFRRAFIMKFFLVALVSLFSLGLMAQTSDEMSKLYMAKDRSYTLEYGNGDCRCPYGYIKFEEKIAMGCLTAQEVSELGEDGKIFDVGSALSFTAFVEASRLIKELPDERVSALSLAAFIEVSRAIKELPDESRKSMNNPPEKQLTE
jgi:hypothetical protein